MHKAISLILTITMSLEPIMAQVSPAQPAQTANIDLKLPNPVQIEIARLQRGWFPLEREVSKLLEDTLHGPTNSANDSIQRLSQSANSLRTDLERVLAEGKSLVLPQLGPILTSHFQIQRNLNFLNWLKNPEALKSLAAASESSEILISVQSFFKIFPTLELLPEGIEFQLNSKGLPTLRLSRDLSWGLYIRALGFSKNVNKTPEESYFKVSKCLLNYEMIHNYVSNELTAGNINFKSPIAETEKACGNITAGEIFKLKKDNFINVATTNSYFERVVNFLPTYTSLINNENVKKQLLQTVKLEDSSFELYKDPAYAYLYANLKTDETDNTDEVTQAISSAFNNLEKRHPGLTPLLELTSDSSFQDQLVNFLEKYASELNAADRNSILKDIPTAEYIYTLDNWDRTWSTLPISGALANSAYGVQQIEAGLRELKLRSLRNSLVLTFSESKSLLTIDPEELADLALQEFGIAYLDQILSHLASSEKVQALLKKINFNAVAGPSINQVELFQMQNKFEIYSSAKNAYTIMDPKTSNNDIPYSRAAILSYYQDKSNEVSRLSARSMESLYNAENFEESAASYTKIKQVLESRQDQTELGEKALAKPSWWDSLLRSETFGSKTAAEIRKDIETLDFMAGRLGLNGNIEERDSLYGALKDQRLNQSEQTDFIKKYREFLTRKEFGRIRILEAPVELWQFSGAARKGSIQLYKILGNPTYSSALKEQALGAALQKVRTNLNTHLIQLAAAKNVSDIKEYTLHSTLLNSLLGTTDLLRYLAEKDFFDMKSGAANIFNSKNVLPSLVSTHLNLKKKWKIEEFTRTESWDMLNSSLMIAIAPLTVGWLARIGFQYMPAALGGRTIPGAIRLASDRMGPQLATYWDFIFYAIIIDAGVASYQIKNSYAKDRTIESLSYTDWAARPMMRQDSFILEHLRNESERKNQYFRLGQDLFWVAFPYLSELAISRIIEPRKAANISNTEKKLAELKEKNPSQAIELEGKIQAKIRRQVDRTSRWLTHDFKALGVEYGEMRPSVLKQARDKIKFSGSIGAKIRADEAYRRVIRETTHTLAPYGSTNVQMEMAIRVSTKTDDEFYLLRDQYKSLFSSPGDKK